MAFQYTVKAGDKSLNSIVQGLGFSNYKAAGVGSVPSGNFDNIREGDVINIGNYTPGQSPTLSSTPAVISSKDMSASFANNSNQLNTKIAPPQAQQTMSEKNAANTDAKNNVAGGDKNSATPTAGKTGNPIWDSLNAWEDQQTKQAQEAAADQKKAQMALLNTSLAAVDSTYSATLGNIENTYNASYAVQSRINKINIARTKAYGLATGGALSTPLEFTNAVSEKETAAAAEIQKLDSARQQAIAEAMAARDAGDAKLMQAHLDAISGIEQDMRTNLANIAKAATDRFTLLNSIAKQQQDDLKVQATKMLAEVVAKQSSSFGDAKTPDEKDKIVNDIVAQSGGVLDYGTVYQGLNQAVADSTKASQDAAYNTARINSANASANASNASAAVNWAKAARGGSEPTESQRAGDVFSGINQLLSGDAKDSNGTPYTYTASDGNQYITAQGFKTLVAAAKEDGITKSKFLDEYGGQLDPGSGDYEGYGLTQADKNKLKGL
jgi:hypothetical protein